MEVNDDKMLDNFDNIEKNEKIKYENIHISNFNKKVTKELDEIINLIDSNLNIKNFKKNLLKEEAVKVLKTFINDTIVGKFYVRSDASIRKFALSIFYTVILSSEKISKNIQKITRNDLAKIAGFKRAAGLSEYYKKYFKHAYPRRKFLFREKGMKEIRLLVSLYYFKLIDKLEQEDKNTDDQVLENYLEKEILIDEGFFAEMKKRSRKKLKNMFKNHEDVFKSYFLDLAKIIKFLRITCKVHKKIKALLRIEPFVIFLEENKINLSQTHRTFYDSIIDIFDFLRKKFPDFFPIRSYSPWDLSESEYKKIVRARLKIFVIKNIYNGKYWKEKKYGKCPLCLRLERRLGKKMKNTDITRLEDLEFHHSSNFKEREYSADKLYSYFLSNRVDPHVLKNLIERMELDKVELICRNHHRVLHAKYYHHFQDLINWTNIPSDIYIPLFELPAEIIHIIIRSAVNNHNLIEEDSKNNAISSVIKFLKKKYIIDRIYDGICPVCGEFDSNSHLPSFDFSHKDHALKTINSSELFDTSHSCSEIVDILDKETGDYVCANCHRIFDKHDEFFPILDKIYDINDIVKKVEDNYRISTERVNLIRKNKCLIEDPFSKSKKISDEIILYLTAIHRIIGNKKTSKCTIKELENELGLKRATIHQFFKRRANLMKHLVDVKIGTSRYNPKTYFLKRKGEKMIDLIIYFRESYRKYRENL